ncbi:DMT family transporter [Candidatus Sororendozoicomonas aggregata]|uniref:DMT family transporter n=1 Tax=Candidatus Sororendozoicomonas aggregata TaxID=3073239 RepID=UPI002ED50FC4
MVKNSQRQAMLFGLSAVLLWSTVATAFKISLNYLTPVQLVLFASITSVITLSLWVSYQQRWHQVVLAFKKKPFYYLLMGLLNPFLYYIVLFKAYDLLPAQQAQPLNYTWALTLTLLAVPLLNQKLTKIDMLACCLGYTGALIIATGGNLMALNFNSPLGVTLALTSTLLWALYWVYNTRNTDDPVVSLLLCFLCSMPLIIFANIYAGGFSIQWQGIAGAIYVGLFEMGITFVLWLTALKKATHIARISNLIFISPFLSLLFISWVLGESIAPSTFIGLIIIVVAVIVQQQQKTTGAINDNNKEKYSQIA